MRIGRLLGISQSELTPLQKGVLCACAVALVTAMGLSAFDLIRFPGVDLRSRIVGSRAWLSGLDPYFFDLGASTPERLKDPSLTPGITRCTYPPTILALYSPLAWIPYRPQRLIWAALEWGALLLSMLLLIRWIKSPAHKVAFAALATFFFAYGDFFRTHVERGQYYVFLLLFLVAGSLLQMSPSKRAQRLAPLFLGIAVAMRAPLAAVPLCLFFGGLRRAAVLTVAVAACFVGVTLFWGIGPWVSYPRGVAHAEEVVSRDHAIVVPIRAVGWIEGYNWDLPKFRPMPGGDTSIQALTWNFLHWSAPMRQFASVGWLAICVLLAVGTSWLLARGAAPIHIIFAAALISAGAMDLSAPVRWDYADVVLLAPIGLLLPDMLQPRRSAFAICCLLTGLFVGFAATATAFPAGWIIGCAVRVMAVLLAGAAAVYGYVGTSARKGNDAGKLQLADRIA